MVRLERLLNELLARDLMEANVKRSMLDEQIRIINRSEYIMSRVNIPNISRACYDQRLKDTTSSKGEQDDISAKRPKKKVIEESKDRSLTNAYNAHLEESTDTIKALLLKGSGRSQIQCNVQLNDCVGYDRSKPITLV